MWKMLGLLAVGLAAGAAIALYTRGDAAADSLLVAGTDAQSVDVQKSLAALDRRVRDLTAQVQALQESPGPRTAAQGERSPSETGQPWRPGDDRPGARDPAQMAEFQERMKERELQRITAAGLTPERMQAINRRVEELRVAGMRAQFEAQSTGQRVPAVDIDQALRKELGDAEYERYLKAEGRSTEVRVVDVLATSAAERSGLKAGDEILSYGGSRVFDARDLNALTMQGAAGGSVTVQVKRDGETLQVQVPAGPLGVTAGPAGGGRQAGFGGPGGGRQGGPGGFRPGG